LLLPTPLTVSSILLYLNAMSREVSLSSTCSYTVSSVFWRHNLMYRFGRQRDHCCWYLNNWIFCQDVEKSRPSLWEYNVMFSDAKKDLSVCRWWRTYIYYYYYYLWSVFNTLKTTMCCIKTAAVCSWQKAVFQFTSAVLRPWEITFKAIHGGSVGAGHGHSPVCENQPCRPQFEDDNEAQNRTRWPIT
jgi:hypothetical protein